MDGPRRFYALVAAAVLPLFVSHALAQGPPMQSRGRPSGVDRSRAQMRPGDQRWQQMSPVDRQRFRSNAERWRRMPVETQRVLRAREISRQEGLQRDAEAAIRDSGLQIEAEKRAQFEQRYVEERKRIEQELQSELREKRKREMEPVVERLKKEFAQPSVAPAADAKATASPSPVK
ncbi:MAG: hypothetical protein ABI946_05280 [Chthoniobacterales bacterium]